MHDFNVRRCVMSANVHTPVIRLHVPLLCGLDLNLSGVFPNTDFSTSAIDIYLSFAWGSSTFRFLS